MAEKINKPAPIQPTTFEAPTASTDAKLQFSSPNNAILTAKVGAPWWHSQFNMMLCAFALLALMALLIIVLLPEPNTSSFNTVLNADGESAVTEQAVSGSNEIEAPWDEGRRQQARSDSQDILAELLVLKKELEAKDVNIWAKIEFESALAQADTGDQFYKNKDFSQALSSYEDARNTLQDLDSLIPAVISKLVVVGNDALTAGKSDLAKAKFKQALNLDQNHLPALSGLDRADNLDKLLALTQSAQLDEQVFSESDLLLDIQSAEVKYQQAISLDSQSELALAGQQRVALKVIDKRYRTAMSGGFNALFSNQYKRAKQGFTAALKLKPNDTTATTAYRQSLASDIGSSLASLIANAKALEQSEDWSQALSTYQAVLQRDSNQVSAKLGVIRSKVRSQLDESLRAVLEDPLALSKSSNRNNAEKVLKDARQIKRKGTVLNQQIVQIENVFRELNTDLKVEFKSDTFTDVHLLKAGSKRIRLGTFLQKRMALKPGRYILIGTRLGYVDVRQEIDLQSGVSDIIKLSIVCSSPINSVSSASN